MDRKFTFGILGVIMLGMLIVMGTEYLRPTPPPPPAGAGTPQAQGKLWSARPPENAPSSPPAPAFSTAAPTPPAAQTPKHTPLPPAGEKSSVVHEKPLPPKQTAQATEAVPSGSQTPPPPEPSKTPPAAAPDTGNAINATAESSVPPIPDTSQQTTGTISGIIVYATQEGATVRINGKDLPPCKVMHLKNPERLVLDMYATCNATVPGIPANRIVGQIRIGKQGKDTSRIVIDLKEANVSSKLVSKNANTLDVRLY